MLPGLLDPNSVFDLWALHFVFIPKIQSQLNSFNDPIRTAHNRTPTQLWILGMCQAHTANPDSPAVQGLSHIDTEVSNSTL